jgi:putative phage-type endonuclease
MDLNIELQNLMCEYFQDNLEHIHKDSFTPNMIQYFTELLKIQLEHDSEENILKSIHDTICTFQGRTTTIYPPLCNIELITNKLNKIKETYQPEQRSPEWFTFRHQLLTASSISKILGSSAKRNELICNKCNSVNIIHTSNYTSGPMHWGIKYEPVSLNYYCYKNKTQVQSYGCLAHSEYPFIGASPDGINVLETSPLYGVMLEIKNPISRQINGNPKEEYWVQCQIQMEVCDLDSCDFLETKFTEYLTEDEFNSDGTFQLTNDNKYKGIILHFEIDGIYHYEYLPFYSTKEEYLVWEESIMIQYPNYIKTIYWKLETVCCSIIPRNKAWFQWFLPQIIELQTIIEREKNTDEWKHRLPKKKTKLLIEPFIN